MKHSQDAIERRADAIAPPAVSASVADRIKYLIDTSRMSQAQFARTVGTDPASLSKMLSGRLSITKRTIWRVATGYGCDRTWLETGEGIPFPRKHSPEAVLDICRGVNAITDPEVLRYNMIGAPVYDIDVTAGHSELSMMFTDEHIIGRLFLPTINPVFPIVRVSGDSMTPQIPNGSFISIRPLTLDATICWGMPYLVVTDDYRMVKILRRHPNPKMLILHSTNPDYDDIDLPRENLRALFLVESAITYNSFI